MAASDSRHPHSTLLLVRQAQDGDARALEALYARYLPRLHAWARGRLPAGARGRFDTGDLVHDALARTLQNLDRLSPEAPGCFQAYTRQAVLNAIRDQVRRRHEDRLDTEVARERPQAGPSPLEEVIGREAMERYDAALARLPAAEREAVVARIELQESWEEIAVILDKPSADAARMTVKRALLRLARTMTELGHEPGGAP
jgi:RNA polymerase sigma-70 factor (ECF subfamily)